MHTTPFWSDDFPRPADLPTVALPDAVDVAIVGSGYTGLSAAIALAKAGARVVVIDAATIGWGASSRNGGMMTTGLKDEMPHVMKVMGEAVGRQLWTWALASIDHVETTVAAEQIDCDFARNGHLYLAYKASHYAAMGEAVDWYAKALDYHAMALVDKADLQTEIGTPTYHGAIVDTRAAGLHPAKYVFGLAQTAAQLGVMLVEEHPVVAIRKTDGQWLVTTRPEQGTAHEVRAGEVLMATNGYTGDVAPQVRQGVFPVGSYIIATERLSPALQAELSPRGRMFFDSKKFLNYFRLTPDGRMLFGGRHNLSPNLDVVESARLMQRRMIEVFPQLADIPLSHTWSGKLGLTFDLLPHVGRVASGPQRGLFYAYGYAGHGVAPASYLGHQAGNLLAGKAEEIPLTHVKQRRYFFTKYDALYLPLVSRWFQVVDKVS